MMKLCERAAGSLCQRSHMTLSLLFVILSSCEELRMFPPLVRTDASSFPDPVLLHQSRAGPQPVGRRHLPVRRSSRPAEVPHGLAVHPAADRLVPDPGQGHRPLLQTGAAATAAADSLKHRGCSDASHREGTPRVPPESFESISSTNLAQSLWEALESGGGVVSVAFP